MHDQFSRCICCGARYELSPVKNVGWVRACDCTLERLAGIKGSVDGGKRAPRRDMSGWTQAERSEYQNCYDMAQYHG